MTSTVPLSKLCELEDFVNDDLLAVIRDVYPPPPTEPDFPVGREQRKLWEVAQAIRGLRDLGAVREDAEILGVGAGGEQTTFWLTRHVRRVFATDLYLTPGEWGDEAAPGMLIEPGRYAGGAWNPRRLVVQHMSGLDLQYEDCSFDGIYSSGSIEHFGTLADVARAASEMCRVLKPGGVAALSTEFRLSGSADLPGAILFTASELQDVIINPYDWDPVDLLDLQVSPATLATMVDFDLAIQETAQGKEWSQWPHIVLYRVGVRWTSVSLTLRKHT